MRLVFLYIMLFALQESCKHNQTIEELKEVFYSKKSKLDFIVNKMETDREFNSLFQIGPDNALPQVKKLNPDIYNALKATGITDASSHTIYKTTTWHYFKTNWSNDYPIYLIYNAYDTSELKKGEHKEDEVSNEWWGLGDHWTLFRLVKMKTMKQ